MSVITDQEILKMLQSAKQQEVDKGLGLLYQRLYPSIAAYIQQNSGQEEDANDIFQDAMIVLYHQVRGKGFMLTSTFKTYLYSICRNLWLKKLRKNNRHTSLTKEMEEIPVAETQLAIIEADERSQNISKLLAQMSEDCRKLLLYFYYDKLRIKEIMALMNISSEAVAKNKKSNCMKQLRRLASDEQFL